MSDSRLTPLATSPLTAAVAALLLLAGGEARAQSIVDAARNLLDLSPQRVERFRAALHEFWAPAGTSFGDGNDIYLESEYSLPREMLDDPDLAIPTGDSGDLMGNEAFFTAGREEDYERAARHWMERQLKGSAPTWRPRHERFGAELAWNGGPLVGVGRGPFTLQVGEDTCRLKFGRALTAGPSPWIARGWVGERDGETGVAFTIGRSLLASRSRSRSR